MTSSDAVLFVRRLLPRKTAVGHGGTLDPDAAGVLPVCVGKATRLFDYIIDKQKTYIGELALGTVTDTCDASGKILEARPVTVSDADVALAVRPFIGRILQVPPMYSALKMDGKKLYQLARKGKSVDIPAREVTIDDIALVGKTGKNRYLLEIRCGKGTYIRSLMRDIGEALGCGGHMSFLLRERAGAFSADDAWTPDELNRLPDLSRALQPMDCLLGAYPRADVKGEYRKRILDGMPVKPDWLKTPLPPTDAPLRLYVEDDFAGMGLMRENGEIAFSAMLLRNE